MEFTFEDRPLNVLVLLAQDKDRYLHDYVLPPKVASGIAGNGYERSNGRVEVK